MIEIVPATLEHAKALAPRMRKGDVNEILASTGESPEDGLVFSVALSPLSWAYLRDGEVMAVFGVAPDSSRVGVGIPWMLAAEGFEKHGVTIVRHTRSYVRRMLDAFPVLENYVDCRNTPAIQWLSYSGFALCEVEPFYGVQRLPFIRFCIAR